MRIIHHLRGLCTAGIELPARCGLAALVAVDTIHRDPMRLPHLPFVKICCIASVEEARLAVAAGASALGLVSAMPSGPGVIGDELIAEIAATVAPPIASFLLTSRQDADSIIEQHQLCRTTTIQLVDQVPAKALRRLRRALRARTTGASAVAFATRSVCRCSSPVV